MQPYKQIFEHKSSDEQQGEQKLFSSQDFKWDSLKEKLWEDELDDLEPSLNSAESNNSKLLQNVLTHEVSEITLYDDEAEKNLEIKDLVDELKPGDTFLAKLSDVNNPFKFWIHLKEEKYEAQLNTLNEEMQEFYSRNQHGDDFKVTDRDHNESRYFALQYSDHWFRVELLGVEGVSVKVSFIDHGSRDIVHINELRRLSRQFFKIPKAVVCCSLGNIKPIGKTFTGESADVFLNLTKNKDFYANILNIDKKKSKATVDITLRSSKLRVNDELIRLGHALPNC